MKNMQKNTNIDAVENLMDDVMETHENQRAIQDALGQPLGMAADLDEVWEFEAGVNKDFVGQCFVVLIVNVYVSGRVGDGTCRPGGRDIRRITVGANHTFSCGNQPSSCSADTSSCYAFCAKPPTHSRYGISLVMSFGQLWYQYPRQTKDQFCSCCSAIKHCRRRCRAGGIAGRDGTLKMKILRTGKPSSQAILYLPQIIYTIYPHAAPSWVPVQELLESL